MKTRIISILNSLLILVSVTACDFNDFLDVRPNATIPTDMAFTNYDDCVVGVVGAYSGLKSYLFTSVGLEAPTSAIRYARWGTNVQSTSRLWTWTAATSDNSGLWATSISTLTRINNTLYGFNQLESTFSAEQKAMAAQYRGELYLMRALSHFELLRNYAYVPRYDAATAETQMGIPLLYKPALTNTSFTAVPRSNMKECADSIKKDLDRAESLIPDVSLRPRASAIYYFSKPAVYALKTRIGLYLSDYNMVIDAADKVTSYGYALTSDAAKFKDIWVNDNATDNNEVIWMVALAPSEALRDYSVSETYYINDSQGDPRPEFLPSMDLIGLYDKVNDMRYGAYFKENVTLRSGTTTEKVTLIWKFPGNSKISTTYRLNQAKPIRYAEVLLNKMEALYYTGGAALAELNAFRAKRINGYASAVLSGADLLTAIKNERLKELAFEGYYFYDLKRWGSGVTRPAKTTTQDQYMAPGDAINITVDNYHWVFPIPQSEINSNPFFKGKQNDKY